MVGFDTGPQCSGTIVRLEPEAAYVVSARHCFVTDSDAGALSLPVSRIHVYLAREDPEGFAWTARPARRIVLGRADARLWTWNNFEFDGGDWAVIEVAREEGMTAIPLADGPLAAAEPAALTTMRPQDITGRPCPHARSLRWGDTGAFGYGGYSGAAIVANGRVQGLFTGYRTRGIWFLEHITVLTVAPASHIARPWLATQNPTPSAALE
jgi:hypothetical protein